MAQAALRRSDSAVACAYLRWMLAALDHGVALDPAQQARIRALYEATNQAAGGPSP